MNVQRGSRDISAVSLTSELGGDGWSTPRPSRSTPWKDSRYPIVREAGWVPVLVWTGAGNVAPYRDSIPGLSGP